MNKLLLGFLLLVSLRSASQPSDNTAKGKLVFSTYDTNIIKLTFEPEGYLRKENPSDAVIRKPAKVYSTAVTDAIVVSKRLQLFVFDKNDFKGFRFMLTPDEKIFGGGERALPLNRRGYRLNLYNNPWYGYVDGADNLNYSVPFITSSNGYALFFDNPSKGYIDIGKTNTDQIEYGTSSGEINVYIIFGDYQTILTSYHKLTGTQPLPPRWALGNLMSRFGYTSEKQVKTILGSMQEAGIPVDAVIFDLFWFGDSIKGTLGNLDWINKTKWPDPKKMIADFKKQNIQTILVTEPFFVETSKNYLASRPYLAVDSTNKPFYLTDFYFGKGGLIDIFRSDAQKWFWQFYKKQMNNGVEAWWGDLGEPEKHPAGLYHNLKDYGYKRLFKADEVHNVYGHTWTKMLYNFYAKEYPQKRLFSLNRSGFAGSQRYGIFPWTGDVSRSWSGLRAQLKVLLGMTMSGVPYVHSDAGGFAGGEGDNELYVRWLQFAAFTPIFRPHGTALYEVEPAAKSFPSEVALIDTPYALMAKKVIELRYAMLPYNYSLSYAQTKSGKPLMAPLYYYHPSDTTAVNIQNEFFWGENILVAPIVEKGVKTNNYYLPAGAWYDPEKRRWKQGQSWYTDSVELNDITMFLKQGSFLPFDERKNAGATNPAEMILFYVASEKPSSFELFEDDGVTKDNLKTGKYQLTKFSAGARKNNLQTIEIKPSGGIYPGKPSHKLIRLTIPYQGRDPQWISINNKKLKKGTGFPEAGEYAIDDKTIYLATDVKQMQSITIHW